MYVTTHAAQILDRQRAIDLAREVELRRRHAEHATAHAAATRPTGFAAIGTWFARATHPRRIDTGALARTAAAH